MNKQDKKARQFPHRAAQGLWITGLLFFIALGLEFLYIRSYQVHYFISKDGYLYTNIAESFLQGKGLVNTVNFAEGANQVMQAIPKNRDYIIGPVYPLLLALIYGIFGLKNYTMVVAVLHAVLGAGSAVLAYKTGELIFGRRYAWIPYLLTLGYPLFAFWGMYILTEVTYVFAIWLFLYCLARYARDVARPKLRTLLILGAVIGLANLVRPLLLLYFPVLGFWIFWMKGWRLKAALRDFCLIVLMTVIVMSPWWIRNELKYHQFIAATNYGSYEFYLGNNPRTITNVYFVFDQPSYDPAVKERIDKLPVEEQEKEYKSLGVSYILSHPVLFVERTIAKEKNLFWKPVSPPEGQEYKMKGDFLDKWYLLLGAAGIVLSLARLKKYSFLLLYILYYSFVVSMITVVSGGRYRLPVMPAMILLGSLFFVVLLKGIGKILGVEQRAGRRA
ncbi:glycosyltransferase family 39 protein [Desulfosporosinus sp. PR]|uniref:ArnT family glycosyltransferase n=1 Tax=Candidatus Desulfosporosinus nitrosoreducens TaxID=3401928 RepID=UPI0027F6556E|nr:glycosyltransferase family 39 protein [Desulfosporosinus sp. PR]MDQ7095565.1 glycosyltransferase family 39 protein [Desulfosporosinus sp. PR]